MANSEYYTFEEAARILGIEQKYLENYAKIGEELKEERVGRRKMISQTEIDKWAVRRKRQTVNLKKEDYMKCLEFAIKSYYHYRSSSDFGTSQQRSAGKFISDFVTGKLGEMALEKFLKENFDIQIKLDFDLRDAVVGQDIAEIAKPRTGGRVYNPPKLRLAVKTSKMKNVWLIVPRKEAEDKERYSDIYIYARVDLFLNHFVRILREHESLSKLKYLIPEFENMDAEICGYIDRNTLTSQPSVKQLPKPKQDIQDSYIIRSGALKNSIKDWETLINQL